MFVFDRIETKVPFFRMFADSSLLSLIKLEILASNLHIFANPFPFGFLKTLTYL